MYWSQRIGMPTMQSRMFRKKSAMGVLIFLVTIPKLKLCRGREKWYSHMEHHPLSKMIVHSYEWKTTQPLWSFIMISKQAVLHTHNCDILHCVYPFVFSRHFGSLYKPCFGSVAGSIYKHSRHKTCKHSLNSRLLSMESLYCGCHTRHQPGPFIYRWPYLYVIRS